MEVHAGQEALLGEFLAPFTDLAGDRRTGRLLDDVVRGIIAGESLICARIAAFSPPIGPRPL